MPQVLRRSLFTAATGVLATGALTCGLITGPAQATQTSGTTPKASATATATAAKAYTFTGLNPDGSPIRWDPCSAIHYRINRNGIVKTGELKHVKAAVAKLSRATKITFVYDGKTSVVPDSGDIPKRAKTDLVFAFAKRGKGAKKSSMLTAASIGVGGSQSVAGGNLDVYRNVEGAVVIKATGFSRLSRRERTSLYLHELAHAVGLGHSGKRTQVMYPMLYANAPAIYRKYDKIGLKKLGRTAGCVRPPGKPATPTLSVSGTQLTISTNAVKSYGKKLTYVLTSYAGNNTKKTWTSTEPTFAIPAPDGWRTFSIRAKDSIGHRDSEFVDFAPAPAG